jgi:hypothetical protein
MTADALLTREARARLLERLDELDELDREMRRPGLLPGSAEPPPLHHTGRTTKNFSTAERTTTS